MILESLDRRARHLTQAILVTAGICLFAWFIHGQAAQRILALAALGFASLVISLSIPTFRSLARSVGLARISKAVGLYAVGGLLLGVLLAVSYRSISNISLYPHTLTIIALVAPAIGVTEELLFRGFLQGRLSTINTPVAVILASLAHTLYKYLVMRSLPFNIGTDFLSLVVFTFVAGLLCGIPRALTKSVVPACVMHGVFDILVYGGLSTWPVWVWC
jgi:membrane protease YdiL (CAAX protease family)